MYLLIVCLAAVSNHHHWRYVDSHTAFQAFQIQGARSLALGRSVKVSSTSLRSAALIFMSQAVALVRQLSSSFTIDLADVLDMS